MGSITVDSLFRLKFSSEQRDNNKKMKKLRAFKKELCCVRCSDILALEWEEEEVEVEWFALRQIMKKIIMIMMKMLLSPSNNNERRISKMKRRRKWKGEEHRMRLNGNRATSEE